MGHYLIYYRVGASSQGPLLRYVNRQYGNNLSFSLSLSLYLSALMVLAMCTARCMLHGAHSSVNSRENELASTVVCTVAARPHCLR